MALDGLSRISGKKKKKRNWESHQEDGSDAKSEKQEKRVELFANKHVWLSSGKVAGAKGNRACGDS